MSYVNRTCRFYTDVLSIDDAHFFITSIDLCLKIGVNNEITFAALNYSLIVRLLVDYSLLIK